MVFSLSLLGNKLNNNNICKEFRPLINKVDSWTIEEVLKTVREWFDKGVFVYSELDNWLKSDMEYNNNGLFVRNNHWFKSLKSNQGTCIDLAIKLNHLLQLKFPGIQCCFINKDNWARDGGNHCYVVLMPNGLSNAPNSLINLNTLIKPKQISFFNEVNLEYFKGYTDAWVLDPTKGVIGYFVDLPAYQNRPGSIAQIRLDNFFNCPRKESDLEFIECTLKPEQKCIFISNSIYAYRFDKDHAEFGSLGIALCYSSYNQKHYEPVWLQNLPSGGFELFSFNFLEFYRNLSDRVVAKKLFTISQKLINNYIRE